MFLIRAMEVSQVAKLTRVVEKYLYYSLPAVCLHYCKDNSIHQCNLVLPQPKQPPHPPDDRCRLDPGGPAYPPPSGLGGEEKAQGSK